MSTPNSQDQKLDQILSLVTSLDAGVTSVLSRIGAIENRMSSLEARMSGLETRFTGVEENVRKLLKFQSVDNADFAISH